ncbi:MAG: hypothetical protein RTU63_10765, partial [Candidatus Thorarchaeota archaeon]
MSTTQPENRELLVSQQKTLHLMRKSHRFLMGHIVGSVFGMYLLMLWAVLFVIIADLPIELLMIASVVILVPIAIIPMQYKTLKEKFGILQQAGK